MALWERRKSADRLVAKQQNASGPDSHEKQFKLHLSEGQRAEAKAGPSFAHELVSDPAGIGFAFGGVDPGVIHAKGQVVKAHTVRYSLGLAGRYRLHVGLRQQSVALPNSPFNLLVTPGHAHARSSHLPEDAIPLVGTVVPVSEGGEVSCSIVVKLSDRMGNMCIEGGAQLKVNTIAKVPKDTSKDASQLASASAGGSEKKREVKHECTDCEDGSYKIEWRSEDAGLYSVSVTIANVHLVGSPMELRLMPGPPDVDKTTVSGDGIESAQAGRPALVCLFCRDTFDNLANRSSTISFGLCLLPRDSKDLIVKKETNEVLRKSDDSSGEPLDSMPFEGAWVGEHYEIRYTAEEAGEFGLHLWTDIEQGKRKFIPGSPFAVRVSGVSASAAGSYLTGEYVGLRRERHRGTSEHVHEGDSSETASLVAGEKLLLNPRLNDEFGNASFASEGTLVGRLEMPDHEPIELPIKQLRELGKYELSYDVQKKGMHTVHVELNGEHIIGSPFQFLVTPAGPIANKSLLYAVDETPVVNTQCELRLEAVDRYGNHLDVGGSTLAARAVGTGVSAVETRDNEDGTYSLKFSGAVAGECRVVVRLDNSEMNPLVVTFVKGAEEAAEEKKVDENGAAAREKKKPGRRASTEAAPEAAPAST